MSKQSKTPERDVAAVASASLAESPHHGYQGDRGSATVVAAQPASLTIAVSREAGARGSTIAKRVGRLLGWQVYNQELLEYLAQEGSVRERLAESLPSGPLHWIDQHMDALSARFSWESNPTFLDLTRTVLALAAQGEVILVGRGAGCMLPAESTLHVRIVAPLDDRIAYMAQWLRLTREQATEQVELRDKHRTEYVTNHFQQDVHDPHVYGLTLNSSLLGEELCAELIAQAARVQLANRQQPRNAPPSWGLGHIEEVS